jgi:hypothetical protein
MTVLTTNAIATPAFTPGINNPFLEPWSKLVTLYKEAMEESAQQLMVSSARIIQEHTMRALMAAAQSCAEELAQNAAKVQQQSMLRFASANQKAFEVMGRAYMDAMMAGIKPAR